MRKVFLFIGVILLSCCAAHAGDVFRSKLWGFSMNKPEGWLPLDSTYIRENVQEYDFTEKQLDKIFALQNRAIIVLALSKYDPSDYYGVIPTIKVNSKRTDITDQNVFLRGMTQTFEGVLKVLDNANFDTEPTLIKINGVPMAYGVISFDLKNDGKTYRARSFIYSVLRKGHFIQFSFTDTTSNDNDCSALYKELASSIIFDKK